MSATATWQGADQDGEVFSIGASGSAIRFTMNEDWAVTTTASPIPAGQSSMVRLLRMMFTGSFSNIANVKFYRSDSSELATGVTIKCGGLEDGLGVPFTAPDTSPTADPDIPESLPGSANVGVDASGTTRYAPALASGEDRFLRLQVQTESGTPPGNISDGDPQFQLSMVYEEN